MTVTQLVDRKLLVSIYEQQRQVCAVRANLWGCIDHPVLIAVTKLMTPLALDFADVTVLRANLKNEWDKRLAAAGLMGVSADKRASMIMDPAQTRR